jgi:hypothetical protein
VVFVIARHEYELAAVDSAFGIGLSTVPRRLNMKLSRSPIAIGVINHRITTGSAGYDASPPRDPGS